MAKEVKLIISGDSKNAEAAIASLQRSGTQAASILEREFNQLGIKSAISFDNQRAAATKAYERIKSSGLATANELERAQKAHTNRLKEIDREQRGTATSAVKLDSAWRGMGQALAGLGVASIARDLFQTQIAMDKIRASMNTTFGSNSGAEIAFIRGESERLGLAFVSTAEAYGKFAAATKGSAISSGEARNIFSSVAEAATAMGLSVEETSGIFNALQQMVSKGTVQAEELRGQLGERLPGAYRLAAQAMGVTEQQLGKMMEKGEVLASDLLPKLAVALHEKFGQAAVDASANAQQALNRWTNAFDKLKATVGNSAAMTEGLEGATRFTSWYDARLSGKIGFFEWMFTGADDAVVKLKAINDEASKLAGPRPKTAEEMAAELAANEQAAKVKADALLKAEEKAKAAREKALTEIRKHNDRILDIEKKRIDQSLTLETAHLQKLTSSYEAAVSAMDSLVSARAAARDTFSAAKDSLNPAEANDDPYTKRLDDLNSLARREQEISASTALNAEEKSRKYAELATAAASYKDAVVLDGVEIISALDAQAAATATILRLEQETALALDEASASRISARDKISEELQESIMKEAEFKKGIEAIETALDRINGKEINIIFRATGAEQILQAAGAVGGSGSTIDTTPINTASSPKVVSVSDLPTYAQGTNYVPNTGLALIHKGEAIIPASQNKPGAGGIVTIAPVINISGVTSTGAEKTARELAREIAPELQKLAGRYR